MKLFTHLLTLSLSLRGVSATPYFSENTNDVGMMLESRANGKMPTYQQVMAASLKKYPGMQAASVSGKLNYDLKACNAKCEKKNEVKDKDGNCKACPKGQKPDKDQTKCVSNGGKEQGKCESGKVLDPAAGGQDATTEKPKCVSDDDSKCPEGQKAESRKKGRDVDESTHKPSCAVDDNPDFTCDDSNTYDYKTIVDNKISHNCRATKKHEDDKKSKYDERVKESKSNKGSKSGDLEKERRKKNRTGWCFVAVAGMGAFDSFGDEVNALTDEEIDGMYGQFPDDAPDPSGDGSIPNWIVAPSLSAIGMGLVNDDSSAGWGAIFKAIPKIVGAFKGHPSTSTAVKNIRFGNLRGPSATAKRAGSKSATIKKIFKDERMRDCVFTGAALASASKREEAITLTHGPFIISIDWSRPKSMPAPAGVSIIMQYDDDEDRLYNNYVTRTEPYYYSNGLPYEGCHRPSINNGIVSVKVEGGCCAFYDGENCESDTHLFDMENREHQDLQGDHRGTISSTWCTAKAGCEGRP